VALFIRGQNVFAFSECSNMSPSISLESSQRSDHQRGSSSAKIQKISNNRHLFFTRRNYSNRVSPISEECGECQQGNSEQVSTWNMEIVRKRNPFPQKILN
jgi:hypothetical protein